MGHVDHELRMLRLQAESLARDADFGGLLGLRERLEAEDPQQWPHMWAPACAVAAAELGRADARDLLEEAVSAGFFQPELFDDDLVRLFSADPEWPRWQARMVANVPPPPIELLDWPDPPAIVAPRLERSDPEREARLRELLPPVAGSAWETAKCLLAWVTVRWEHANDHVEQADALHVLERVDAGERFACVEYSIVLTQALNAVGIPARRLALRCANAHIGIGRGHVVSEAWIDDLGRWVLLDGQNGAYWAGADELPLGPVELRRAALDGRSPARMFGLGAPIDAAAARMWWQYFAGGSTTGAAWGAGPTYVPIVQEVWLGATGLLVKDPAAVYPDLCTVTVGVAGSVAAPALTFATAHPFASGYRVAGQDLGLADPWPLRTDPGEHVADVQVVTGYGAFPAGRVEYRVR